LFDWKNFLESLERKTLGIVNITDDSFSGDGVLNSNQQLQKKFEIAIYNDIKLLDIGCMSSKPGFKILKRNEEINRLNYFLQNKSNKFFYSIDTFNPLVAKKALDSGFLIINDVSGFVNEKMIELASKTKCGIILMHRNPKSTDLHEKMDYSNVIEEVNTHLIDQIENLIKSGIEEKQIAVDPGLGFGKKIDDSIELFLNLKNLINTYPLVVGYSKKRFIEKINMTKSELQKHCIDSGVALVRLHLDN